MVYAANDAGSLNRPIKWLRNMIKIRSYEAGDEHQIGSVFDRSIKAIGSAHYSESQINAWVANAPSIEAIRARCTDGRTTLVALNDHEANPAIVAYIDLESDGHIDHFYCLAEASQSGVAQALYERIEQLAESQGIVRLFTEASEAARRFFERHGFTLLHRRDLTVRGVAIHNFAMQKLIG